MEFLVLGRRPLHEPLALAVVAVWVDHSAIGLQTPTGKVDRPVSTGLGGSAVFGGGCAEIVPGFSSGSSHGVCPLEAASAGGDALVVRRHGLGFAPTGVVPLR